MDLLENLNFFAYQPQSKILYQLVRKPEPTSKVLRELGAIVGSNGDQVDILAEGPENLADIFEDIAAASSSIPIDSLDRQKLLSTPHPCQRPLEAIARAAWE